MPLHLTTTNASRYAMSSSMSDVSDLRLPNFQLLEPVAAPSKSFLDLTNPGLVLIIWDILLGIPFSLFIAVVNKAFMQWLGYEKIMRCPSGIFASRAIMLLVNLVVLWGWRKQLIQEERENRVKTEIKMLDEVIACLEKVLAGVEAKEVDEQLTNENENAKGQVEDSFVDRKAWAEWNKKKKSIARKI